MWKTKEIDGKNKETRRLAFCQHFVLKIINKMYNIYFTTIIN